MEKNAENINKNLGGAISKAPRSSNLELYRIVCMLLIVAHHYVVNSGLSSMGEPLTVDFTSGNSIFLTLFGAWGKVGINCFIMITGYFMCTSEITVRKFLKLLVQIYFYRMLLFPIFLASGYETLSALRIIKLLMPFGGFSDDFVSCFIIFYLTIPFLSMLTRNMNRSQHELLLLILLGIYTVLGSVPTFNIRFNYITWFGVIFFVASYIRIYPRAIYENRRLWGWMTLLSISLAIISILLLRKLFGERLGMGYLLLSDCNKIFAVSVAVASFLWFKSMNIKYCKVINAVGAATFGVLLIHANSNAMRQWLWKDFVDVVGHYETLATSELVLYSIGVVLAIFVICNLIDQLRIATIEKWFLDWYDRKWSAKADAIIESMKK